MKYFIYFLIASVLLSCKDKPKEDSGAIINTTDSTVISFNEKIKKDPDNPDLYHQRAKYFFSQRDAQSALADMKRTLSLDSTKAEYFITLAEISLTKGMGGTVKSSLQKALQLDPENAEALMKLAELELYFKNYKETIALLDKVLKKDRYNAKAYFIKGITFKEMGDTTRAISSFQTTVEQDPDYYHAYVELGLLFSDRKNPLALDYLNNALNLNPKSIEALYAIGFFAQENKMYDKSIQAYNTILQVDSSYKDAHYNLGYVHSEYLKDYKKAVKHYSDAIKFHPNSPETFYMRGYSHERLGNKTLAEADYRASLKIQPAYDLPAVGLSRLGF